MGEEEVIDPGGQTEVTDEGSQEQPSAEVQPEEVSQEQAAEETDQELPELPEGVQSFDREYVQGLREQTADYRTKYREATEKFTPLVERLGGEEHLTQAVGVYEALRTKEGVEKLFVEAGGLLGVSTDQLTALIKADSDATPTTEPESPDADEPLTRAEFDRMMKENMAQYQEQILTNQVQQAVESKFTELGVADHKIRNLIIELADEYVSPDENDPRKLADAVTKGHADWIALLESKGKEYAKTKIAAAKKTPAAVKPSATPTNEAEKEPQDWKEADERVRKRLGV